MAEAMQQEAAADESRSVLEMIFEDGRLVKNEHQTDSARLMLKGFIEEATRAGTQVDGTAKRAIAARIAALDRLISEQVNEILHHEKFQRLEASWRNLEKLVKENDLSSSMKVRVLNCNRKEMEKDFARAPGFDQSTFFKHIYEREFGTLGGSPFTFILGNCSPDLGSRMTNS